MPLPEWARTLPWELIFQAAKKHGLDHTLIAAVIQTESAGQTTAYRYEKNYRWLYHPAKLGTQLRVPHYFMVEMQKTSWGMCQVMGAVAYELGLSKDGDYPLPPVLLIPETGIKYGCLALRRILDSPKHYNVNPSVPDDIYAAYNAGKCRKRADFKYRNHKHVEHFHRNYSALS